jgi:hypothetical protein
MDQAAEFAMREMATLAARAGGLSRQEAHTL